MRTVFQMGGLRSRTSRSPWIRSGPIEDPKIQSFSIVAVWVGDNWSFRFFGFQIKEFRLVRISGPDGVVEVQEKASFMILLG